MFVSFAFTATLISLNVISRVVVVVVFFAAYVAVMHSLSVVDHISLTVLHSNKLQRRIVMIKAYPEIGIFD